MGLYIGNWNYTDILNTDRQAIRLAWECLVPSLGVNLKGGGVGQSLTEYRSGT